MISCVDATAEHIPLLVARARQADVDEVGAANGATIAQALEHGLAHSRRAYTVFLDGEVACMFGATPYSELSGIGVAWMLGTTVLDRGLARKCLLRHAGPAIRHLLELYPSLIFNYVDARNTRAIRFLRWAGFTVMSAIPYGRDRRPFHPFYLQGAPSCASR